MLDAKILLSINRTHQDSLFLNWYLNIERSKTICNVEKCFKVTVVSYPSGFEKGVWNIAQISICNNNDVHTQYSFSV